MYFRFLFIFILKLSTSIAILPEEDQHAEKTTFDHNLKIPFHLSTFVAPKSFENQEKPDDTFIESRNFDQPVKTPFDLISLVAPKSFEIQENSDDTFKESRNFDHPVKSPFDLIPFVAPKSFENQEKSEDSFPENRKFDREMINLINDVLFSAQKTFQNIKDSDIKILKFNEMLQEFSPRVLNRVQLLKNNFINAHKIDPKTMIQRLNETCRIRRGVLVNEECYQYFNEDKTWDEARAFCIGKGGDLWTPDYNDRNLLGKLIPAVIDVYTPLRTIWVGAKLSSGKIIDINNNDISSTYFALRNEGTTGNCLAYYYDWGYAQSSNIACTRLERVICEFPITVSLTPSKYSSVSINPFPFFKG